MHWELNWELWPTERISTTANYTSANHTNNAKWYSYGCSHAKSKSVFERSSRIEQSSGANPSISQWQWLQSKWNSNEKSDCCTCENATRPSITSTDSTSATTKESNTNSHSNRTRPTTLECRSNWKWDQWKQPCSQRCKYVARKKCGTEPESGKWICTKW